MTRTREIQNAIYVLLDQKPSNLKGLVYQMPNSSANLDRQITNYSLYYKKTTSFKPNSKAFLKHRIYIDVL